MSRLVLTRRGRLVRDFVLIAGTLALIAGVGWPVIVYLMGGLS